ncbi:hypothetical protein APSETT445_001829 [Aspergillus pseudonomiae]
MALDPWFQLIFPGKHLESPGTGEIDKTPRLMMLVLSGRKNHFISMAHQTQSTATCFSDVQNAYVYLAYYHSLVLLSDDPFDMLRSRNGSVDKNVYWDSPWTVGGNKLKVTTPNGEDPEWGYEITQFGGSGQTSGPLGNVTIKFRLYA